MRASLWAVLVGLCLAVSLICVEPGRSQTASGTGLFPVGRPFTMAGGFTGPVQNVPIDTTNVIAPIPQQSTGMIMPNFRRFMIPPKTNVVHGTSPLPTPSQMPGASFFNGFNVFKK